MNHPEIRKHLLYFSESLAETATDYQCSCIYRKLEMLLNHWFQLKRVQIFKDKTISRTISVMDVVTVNFLALLVCKGFVGNRNGSFNLSNHCVFFCFFISNIQPSEIFHL